MKNKKIPKTIKIILLIILILSFTNIVQAKNFNLENLIDQSGRKIKKGPYKRIISLYGAHTENLYSLGLDAEIIGVSNDEDYPPEVKNKEKFNANDGLEKFLAAKPDLVLMRPQHVSAYGRLVESLEKNGVTVVSLQVVEAKDLYDYWRFLAVLVGREKEAQEMIFTFKNEIEKLKLKPNSQKYKPKVFMEVFHRNVKTYVSTAIPMWLLNLAGGESVAGDVNSLSKTAVGEFGRERLLAKQNEIDIYFIMTGPMNNTTKEEIINNSFYKNIKAVQNNKIYNLDESLVARPTLRLILGLKQMENIFETYNND